MVVPNPSFTAITAAAAAARTTTRQTARRFTCREIGSMIHHQCMKSSSLSSRSTRSVFVVPRSFMALSTTQTPTPNVTAVNCCSTSSHNYNNIVRLFSTQAHTASTASTEAEAQVASYAVVDHSIAYEEAMSGRHGKQLALAYNEGIGKDDPPYNPFQQDYNDLDELDEEDEEDDDEEDYDEKEDQEEEEEQYDSTTTQLQQQQQQQQQQLPYPPPSNRTKAQLASLRAGAPSDETNPIFAIIRLAGIQHKVTTDDVIILNKLKPISTFRVGSIHTVPLHDVLLVGTKHKTWVGLPFVPSREVGVSFRVEEITHDATVLVFKKRRRKHSRRKNGFRREVTFVRILDIQLPTNSSSGGDDDDDTD